MVPLTLALTEGWGWGEEDVETELRRWRRAAERGGHSYSAWHAGSREGSVFVGFCFRRAGTGEGV